MPLVLQALLKNGWYSSNVRIHLVHKLHDSVHLKHVPPAEDYQPFVTKQVSEHSSYSLGSSSGQMPSLKALLLQLNHKYLKTSHTDWSKDHRKMVSLWLSFRSHYPKALNIIVKIKSTKKSTPHKEFGDKRQSAHVCCWTSGRSSNKNKEPCICIGFSLHPPRDPQTLLYTNGLRSHCCRSFLTSKSLFNSSPRTFPFKLIQ